MMLPMFRQPWVLTEWMPKHVWFDIDKVCFCGSFVRLPGADVSDQVACQMRATCKMPIVYPFFLHAYDLGSCLSVFNHVQDPSLLATHRGSLCGCVLLERVFIALPTLDDPFAEASLASRGNDNLQRYFLNKSCTHPWHCTHTPALNSPSTVFKNLVKCAVSDPPRRIADALLTRTFLKVQGYTDIYLRE